MQRKQKQATVYLHLSLFPTTKGCSIFVEDNPQGLTGKFVSATDNFKCDQTQSSNTRHTTKNEAGKMGDVHTLVFRTTRARRWCCQKAYHTDKEESSSSSSSRMHCILLGLLAFLVGHAHYFAVSAFFVPTRNHHHYYWYSQSSLNAAAASDESLSSLSSSSSSSSTFTDKIPLGRVANITEWLTWSDLSLARLSKDGKGGIYSRVNAILQADHVDDDDNNNNTTSLPVLLTTPYDLDTSTRFAILSHGNQTDPVYNYVNAAGFAVFQWPPKVYHCLPSRYSAPRGANRQLRASVITNTTATDITYIDQAVRVRYPNATVTLRHAILWNVYDSDGVRRGQTVLFDAHAVTIHDASADQVVTYELVTHQEEA